MFAASSDQNFVTDSNQPHPPHPAISTAASYKVIIILHIIINLLYSTSFINQS